MNGTLTITMVLTKATTSVMSEPNQAVTLEPSSAHWLSLSSVFKLVLLLCIPLFRSFATRRRLEIVQTEDMACNLATAWQEPWLTTDWATLYGLIGLAQQGDIESAHTPFHADKLCTIQKKLRGENYGKTSRSRWALRRLLEYGVIPLTIQDGGVSTAKTRDWELVSTFPFLTLPSYQQTKKRAFFEVLIPHPEADGVTRLVRLLRRNRMGYVVSCRVYDAKTRRTRTIITPAVPRSGCVDGEYFPLSVGAEASCEVILPFLPDEQVQSAHGMRVHSLSMYVEEGTAEMPRAPLLHWSSWALVRVEAAHWGHVELDHYVLGAVQDSGMEIRWVEGVCEGKAVAEVGRVGLEL
jgi:hypothetical protein